MSEDSKQKEVYGILPKTVGGGPKGYGDPDDRTLRHVEKDIMIPKKIKEKAHKEKCAEDVEVWTECAKRQGLLMPFLCRKEVRAMNQCLEKWYYDKDMIALCTEEYLKERSEFRRTGIKKDKKSN